MISSEKIVEVMLCQQEENGISGIKITPDGDIVSHLDNRIDSEKPYFLAVRRCEEEQKICIYASGFLNNCKDSDIYRKLMLLNLGLGCSCISINPDDGKLFFKLEHFFEEDEEPSVEFFAGLLFRYLREARFIERILLYESMLDNGLSKESAEQFVKTLLWNTSDFRFVDWDQTLMEEPVRKEHLKEHES
jgi:hypothetical protein